MIRTILFSVLTAFVISITMSFRENESPSVYRSYYLENLHKFQQSEENLLVVIKNSTIGLDGDKENIKKHIQLSRNNLKAMDFWFRYLDPLSHKKLNGPLPVEWETEVFEKHEKPYKREGAGLTLIYQYLEDGNIDKNIISKLIQQGIDVLPSYSNDSITSLLNTYHHFYLCNRLYLLNLATIYTTGFECPNTESIVPELRLLLLETNKIYTAFNQSFPNTPISKSYQDIYISSIQFAQEQSDDYSKFDHYTFIREYINPLYLLNQQMIKQYNVISKSLIDYSLNKNAKSIFSKNLYFGQNPKGIFTRVQDETSLAEIENIGKQLFYDPILSGNNERSCASCHSPTQYFTDTIKPTAITFNHNGFLTRNTPTLLNAQYNHLLMVDGKHYSLQSQAKSVITNPEEMGCQEKEIVLKVLSCKEYKKILTNLLKLTPQEKEITIEHISSAITFYYSKYSKFTSPFDDAMNKQNQVHTDVQKGYNVFMSKAQCGTCHFAPQFNGVKPPYIGSEFEVLGVPKDTTYSLISPDKGRYEINPAPETLNAFRTGTIRNSAHTKPYMHNGVFTTLEQVIDFYDTGGGAGRSLIIPNQTLSSDSLHLTAIEKKQLILFIESLNENIVFEQPPQSIPVSSIKILNSRKVGGTY